MCTTPHSTQPGTIRIAAFQRRPIHDDIGEVTRRMLDDLRRCAAQGVQLAIFPECYLQGYTTDARTIARRAVAVDSVPFRRFASALSALPVDALIGFIERRAEGYYNSAAVLRGGALLGVYAKNHPNEQAFLPGGDSPAFETGRLRYGINICNDANFSESAQRLTALGARLICYPLNNMLRAATAEAWRERSVANLRARAVETGCWVVSSDVVGSEGDRISHGCSCIVRPDGTVAARVPEDAEGVVMHDIDTL